LQGTFVQFPSSIRIIAQEFEAIHEIPHIIGAINGSHIPIFAPVIGRDDYSYGTSFH